MALFNTQTLIADGGKCHFIKKATLCTPQLPVNNHCKFCQKIRLALPAGNRGLGNGKALARCGPSALPHSSPKIKAPQVQAPDMGQRALA